MELTARLRRAKSQALRWLLAVLVFIAVAGCEKAERAQPQVDLNKPQQTWLEDVTEASGLRFKHEVGPSDRFFMPETVGSGAAFLDYDNDGRLDIYLIQNAGPNSQARNKLFRQGADGGFQDVSAGSGLDVAGYGMGVAVGDANNDGLPDVLVTEYGRVRFFANRGTGKFAEVTSEAGMEDSHWATSAAFFDYDRDGWLDLVIVNYIDYLESEKCYDRAGKPDYCGPNSRPGTVTQLFHNLTGLNSSSSSPKFEEVTLKSGLAELPGPGLGVVCADFDGDDWPDILVANDARPNVLWINRRDGTFKNEAAQRGIAYNEMGTAQANMGIAFGDVTGDGLFDIYITHLSEENNVMWFQGPRGLFQDRTAAANLANTAWHGTGFGSAFVDFDNDGNLDLALVNGRVRRSNERGMGAPLVPKLGHHWSAYGERNQIFANTGTGLFRDVSSSNPALCSEPNVGRGLACADINNDGGMDLLITAVAEPARLLRNVAPKRGHWLLVKAVDPKLGGRDAYGAKITVRTPWRTHVNWINPGYSYVCSNDPRAHFGLGEKASIDSIQVLWPDGVVEEFPTPRIDHHIVLRRGTGGPVR
jgi:enediyne biosynthesis protein E4